MGSRARLRGAPAGSTPTRTSSGILLLLAALNHDWHVGTKYSFNLIDLTGITTRSNAPTTTTASSDAMVTRTGLDTSIDD